MKYNILSIADIHWGVMNPSVQFDNLEEFIIFIELFKNIDLVIIDGDYYDSKLLLNSDSAVFSTYWMHKLITACEQNGVKKIRIIKGTKEHDNEQLDTFKGFEKEDGYFKIFNINTVEETLPGLKCIYCPDENINHKDYVNINIDNILEYADIGFFHGSFDIVLPDIVVQLSEESSINNLIFEYKFWSKFIKGPLIAGHWHNGQEIDSLIYLGSYDRWAFGEPEPKGFGFIQFDTETNRYFYKKIINNNAKQYITYNIDTSIMKDLEEYKNLFLSIDNLLKDRGDIKVRIIINITDEKPSNDSYITSVREYFINNKQVKIIVKNKIHIKNKKSLQQQNKNMIDKFDFIMDKKENYAAIIQKFIKTTKDKDIPIEFIEAVIKKYL